MIAAIFTVILLAALEVSLSFDNAVVNAAVLRKMDARWQRIFLSWGILIAVFGVRLVLPMVIVTLSAGLPVADVVRMVLFQPDIYSQHIQASHDTIAAFGGTFLLLVYLSFLCDEEKDVHWIGWAEKSLAKIGGIKSIEIAIALLIVILYHAPIIPALVGVLAFIGLKGLAGKVAPGAGKSVAVGGLSGFLYLEVLDASFSLDGVVGAFAITSNILIIMLGLGIGAFAIRSLTVHMVRQGTLDEFIYLEHGAHWGIGALAFILLTSTVIHVPEIITGLVGMTIIGMSLLSSIKHRKFQKLQTQI